MTSSTPPMLTIYNEGTAEERSCTQEEWDTTFAETGDWDIIEPIGDVDPLATITLTNPSTGETKTVTGAEWLELRPKGEWKPLDPIAKPDDDRRAGANPALKRSRLRTEEKGRDEAQR